MPSSSTTKQRKIIHVDMDAFYASIEQRDNPELKGKPVAVGGSSKRGVVAAASYEARKFGVRSAMPSMTAARLCPNLVFVKPRFEVYQMVSKAIKSIFYEYTDLVEPLSLDEAFLDVTENKPGIPSATLIAKEIRQKIKTETNLTASAGVSYCKFLAKIASDQDKPDGLFVIEPHQANAFLEQLKIEKFFGIGKVTAEKMHQHGIYNGADLKQKEEAYLVQYFGKVGRYYYKIVRGIDNRPVSPDRIRKSISAENTFFDNLTTMDEILEQLDRISTTTWTRMSKTNTLGRTVTIKVRFENFETITRSKSYPTMVDSELLLKAAARELMMGVDRVPLQVRLLGVGVSNLNNQEEEEGEQQQLRLDL